MTEVPTEQNISLRLSAAEKRTLSGAAHAAKLSLSAFVREAALREAERQRDERIERGVPSA
jgi:uncharacterized protein (DUF1778 family)